MTCRVAVAALAALLAVATLPAAAQSAAASDVATYLLLKGKAEQGDAQAAYQLADRLVDGQGIVQDVPAAFYWYQRAEEGGVEAGSTYGELFDLATPELDTLLDEAGRGHVRAMLELANIYQRGHHAPHDGTKARFWLEMAARELRLLDGTEDWLAMYELALLLRRSDPQKAQALLERIWQLAAKQPEGGEGQPEALRDGAVGQLASLMEATHNPRQAQRYWRRAQLPAHKSAFARSLALINCQAGEYAEAKEWFGREITQPEHEGVNARAAAYCRGRIAEMLDKDLDAARGYYEAAAEFNVYHERRAILWGAGGDAWIGCAEYRLAELLDPEDDTETGGSEWLGKAAAHGHVDAQHQLGLSFANAGDALSARYWLQQAAAQGHVGALFDMADLRGLAPAHAQEYRERAERLERATVKVLDCPLYRPATDTAP